MRLSKYNKKLLPVSFYCAVANMLSLIVSIAMQKKITKDSNKLESHIREIDTAMQEVESSNQQLVDNMEKVSDIVETMPSCISDSDVVSRKMLSKYDENATNINNIESIIQALTSNFE